jgi:hypothetical protein
LGQAAAGGKATSETVLTSQILTGLMGSALMYMKISYALILAVLCCGCATSTIEKRRTERFEAYQKLEPEQKSAVDQGKIRVGMTSDAVYIALGRPNEVLRSENAKGSRETWLYYGEVLQEYRYWSAYPWVGHGGRYYYGAPYLAYDYYPRRYVATEVVFENGRVKEWRNLAAPR